MAVITKTNVTELVQIYYELRRTQETVKEKCHKMHEMHGGKMPLSDIYNVFWAIRILAETYAPDDIEFHVNKNPIFAEIPSDYEDDKHADNKHAEKPKQVGLLRQAVRECQFLLSNKISMVNLEAKL
jgi:hypothetical protein